MPQVGRNNRNGVWSVCHFNRCHSGTSTSYNSARQDYCAGTGEVQQIKLDHNYIYVNELLGSLDQYSSQTHNINKWHKRGHAKLCRQGGRRGRWSTTVKPHRGRVTAANWLIDVIDAPIVIT